jgi:hypothetical protein
MGCVLAHLEVHATEPCAALIVCRKRLKKLSKNCVKRSRLDASGCAVRVAVHGVALPHHAKTRFGHRLDNLTQFCTDLACTEARDEDDFAWHVVRVEELDELDELGWDCCWAALAPDRVGDASEVPERASRA